MKIRLGCMKQSVGSGDEFGLNMGLSYDCAINNEIALSIFIVENKQQPKNPEFKHGQQFPNLH